MTNGDYQHPETGEVLGNIFDYLPSERRRATGLSPRISRPRMKSRLPGQKEAIMTKCVAPISGIENDGGRPSQVRVMLRIIGADLDPKEISQALGLRPSKSFHRGDSFQAGGLMHQRAYGAWTLSTEETVRSDELLEHCAKLLEWLGPARQELKTYRSRENIRTSVAFWWAPCHGPVGFTLAAPVLSQLAEMCTDFEFYFA